MKNRTLPFIAPMLLVAVLQNAHAADTSDPLPMESIPDGQVVVPAVQAPDAPPALLSPQTVEVRNNSPFSVLVVQKGHKETLETKGILERNVSQYPVSVTPADGTAKLKFVTLTSKTGTCKQQFCLIVQ
ncbi:hypothetical protein [Pseudomonas sp. R3-18-08]|uniref:hypothetical protein n=1 Tax=Pseudomonas sp. R3-18-08 TaxID=1173283 RepID=UPI000F565531|nr:hypothetical protein [Pseudomonas sp. R3-18-08]AZF14185.1 hypothetical protein C4J92_0673 [Pseudomonas sp. R3-18-08]